MKSPVILEIGLHVLATEQDLNNTRALAPRQKWDLPVLINVNARYVSSDKMDERLPFLGFHRVSIRSGVNVKSQSQFINNSLAQHKLRTETVRELARG